MGVTELRNSDNRDWLLRSELCSLFHDMGKLSMAFLKYRRTWYADSNPDAYNKDPHDHDFLDQHETPEFKNKYSILLEQMSQEITFAIGCSERFSPKRVMSSHVAPSPHIVYEQALKAADALDSAIDRNNPLPAGEQCDHSKPPQENEILRSFYRSNVFGYESQISDDNLETNREQLYAALSSEDLIKTCWLRPPDKDPAPRRRLLKLLEDQYKPACSDTTRPGNDTSLFEHVYAVTTITKVFQAWYLLYHSGITAEKLEEHNVFQSARFTIWGLGWDAVRFIQRGQKIADLTTRRDLLRQVRHAAREKIEFIYALGNAIYEDDNCILFLIPEKMDSNSIGEAYQHWLEIIGREILDGSLIISKGELWPRFVSLGHGTRDITDIVFVLNKLRQEFGFPIHADGRIVADGRLEPFQHYLPSILDQEICPICRLRTYPRARSDKRCEICARRRSRGASQLRQADAATLFINEIARGRDVALLVARIGLDPWLDGSRIRTLYVTEPRGLSRQAVDLGNTQLFKADELKSKQYLETARGQDWSNYDAERLRQEVAVCLKAFADTADQEELKLASAVICFYRQFWPGGRFNQTPKDPRQAWPLENHHGEFAPSAAKVSELRELAGQIADTPVRLSQLINLITAKSPTPSTVLDVWRTTQEYFSSLTSPNTQSGSDSTPLLRKYLPRMQRWGFILESHLALEKVLAPNAVYKAFIADQPVEFVWDDENNRIELINQASTDAFIGKSLTRICDADSGEPLRLESIPLSGNPTARDYYPYREILATPEIFIALVPAARAVELSGRITAEFQRRFGKVSGRLSFSIGNLFFQPRFPMYIALDAARRMLLAFQSRHNMSGSYKLCQQPTNAGNGYTDLHLAGDLHWRVPAYLGDGRDDSYHPYFIVSEESLNEDDRHHAMPDSLGRLCVLHLRDLRPGMRIIAADCAYDYEYLDSSTRRFALQVAEHGHRPSYAWNDQQVRPIRLELLMSHLIEIRDLLAAGIPSESVRHSLIDLLAEKIRTWRIGLPYPAPAAETPGHIEWRELARQQIEYHAAALTAAQRAFLLDRCCDGSIFEAYALFHQNPPEEDRASASKTTLARVDEAGQPVARSGA